MRFYFPPIDLTRELIFLLRGDFNTDDAAPVGSPLSLSPGPGSLTFVQTDGTIAIADGAIEFTAQTTPTWGDQGFYGTGIARAAGVALIGQFALSTWEECGFGWKSDASVGSYSANRYHITLNATNGQLDYLADTDIGAIRSGLNTANQFFFVLILRAAGCFLIVKIGDNYELLWHVGTTVNTPLYPHFTNYDGAGKIGTVRVAQLGSPWSDDSIFTDVIASPSEGESFDHTADFTLEFTVDSFANTIYVKFRIQDTDNYWAIRYTATGQGALMRYEGGIAVLASNFFIGVASAGDVVRVRCAGNLTRVWQDDVLAKTSTNATFSTETGGLVNMAAGSVSDISTLPYYLTGDAKETIETRIADVTALSGGAALQPYLVAYYDFEGAAGDDESDLHGNAEDMAQTNSPPSVAGKLTNGRHTVDGATDRYFEIATPHSFAFGGSFTITGWVYQVSIPSNGSTSYHALFSAADVYEIKTTYNDKIAFTVEGDSDTAVVHGATATGAWQFFATVHDAATKTIYIYIGDAGGLNMDASDTYTGGYSAPADPVDIGLGQNTPASEVYVDSFAIFNKALSADEVDFIWNNGDGRAYSDYA